MVVTSATQNPTKPKIISEVRKTCLSKMKLGFTKSLQDFGKPKISGQLIWDKSSSERHLRMAEVRHGNLFLFKNDPCGVEFRLPLRQLSLLPCHRPRSFRLNRGLEAFEVTFQALTDNDFEKWVKVLAVELIRQTPLQDVRFLDIISIIQKRDLDKTNMKRAKSEECFMLVNESFWDSRKQYKELSSNISKNSKYRSLSDTTACEESEKHQKTPWSIYNFNDIEKSLKNIYKINEDVSSNGNSESNILERTGMWKNKTKRGEWLRFESAKNREIMDLGNKLNESGFTSDESRISSGDENNNQSNNILINSKAKSRNQKRELFGFVSVREKKKFFESLRSDAEGGSSLTEEIFLTRSNSISDIKVFSKENTKLKRRKRTKSLHDLRETPMPVREICRLFEPLGGAVSIIEKKDTIVKNFTKARNQ